MYCFEGESMDDKPKEVNPEVTTEKDEELLKVTSKLVRDLQHLCMLCTTNSAVCGCNIHIRNTRISRTRHGGTPLNYILITHAMS